MSKKKMILVTIIFFVPTLVSAALGYTVKIIVLAFKEGWGE